MADGTGLNDTAHVAPLAQPRSNKLPDRPLEITIHDLWRRILGRPDIGVKETFADLGGYPAQAKRMLADVERIIRRPLPEGAWRQQLTIRNLSRAIAQEAEKEGRLVTCAAEGEGRPFFFCHGDYSTRGFYALDLAERLGGRTAVYLLHPTYEPGGTVSLDDMAKGYVDEIVRLQPKGPVDVGGYCNGGTVAWAVAHQLAARGIEVNRLVLIDTMTLNARTTFRTVARMAGDRRIKVMSELWWQATEYRPGPLMMAFHMVTLAVGRKVPDVPQRTTRLARVEDAACYTLAPYMLPKAPCHVDYVLAADSVGQAEFQAGPLAKLAPSLSRHVVSGAHLTCITTHADSLAAVLRSVLEAPPPPRKAAQRRGFGFSPFAPNSVEASTSPVSAEL
jgi:oxalate---CoA ligase